MYCVHCGTNLGSADLYCTRCGNPRAAGQPAAAVVLSQPGVALPPNLHWGLLILLNMITCGIFSTVWSFVQANWAKKLAPDNKALQFMVAYVACAVVAIGLSIDERTALIGSLVNLAGVVCFIIAMFKIRAAMEEYYNSTENIGLTLSGVMTFFFGLLYFQYHINRIARWKKTGVLT